MRAKKKYFDFRVFKGPYEFASNIYHKVSLKDEKGSWNRMFAKLDDFKMYSPKKTRNNRRKTRNITDVERLYDYRNMVTEAFEDEVLPFKDGFKKKTSQLCLIKNYQTG